MASEFFVYLQLGFHHIADFAGYDHMLFIAALSIGYEVGQWRKLAILVTAFTVGHSITLALATLRLVSVPSRIVEALIPLTIIVTAIVAAVEQQRVSRGSTRSAFRTAFAPGRYLLAAVFGLIHGLGFSTYLRTLLGQEENIALPLFGFNLGLEFGQLLILLVILLLSLSVTRGLRLHTRNWTYVMAGATGGIALVLLVKRLAGKA